MFFNLRESTEKGNFGIREENEPGYDWEAPTSQDNLSYFNFPDFDPAFSGLILTKISKEVDLIDDGGAIGGNGLLVSEKLKDLFSSCKLPEHRTYEVPLLDRKTYTKTGRKYYWIQLLDESNYAWIDFDSSEFIMTDFFDENEKEIIVKSVEDLEQRYGSINRLKERLKYKKIVLRNDLLQNTPVVFSLGQLNSYLIFNQKLKELFLENSISGLKEFKQLPISLEKE